MRFRLSLFAQTMLLVSMAIVCADLRGDEADDFESRMRPLLQRYCHECHSAEVTEADVDLGKFETLEDVQHESEVWLKVRQILASGDMPPKDSPQLSDSERDELTTWVRTFLAREAQAVAGDPGLIVLRRLNNEEYNYTVRDLTGVDSLDPTQEFPVDGAAGEGFINSGSAQSMSSAFVSKYLDSAKDVAAHVVLLPEGIDFSPSTTRRDQTDEMLARIQSFYRYFTKEGGGSAVDLQGIRFTTNEGGLLPLQEYIAATLEERAALVAGDKSIETVAKERALNVKYLNRLWQTLTENKTATNNRSFYLNELRRLWREAAPQHASKLAAHIEAIQKQLWKFNAIGQLTDGGRQKIWMEAVTPVVTQQDLRLTMPTEDYVSDVNVLLTIIDVGADKREAEHDRGSVVLRRPRVEFKPNANGVTHPPILLRDMDGLVPRVKALMSAELARTQNYLSAAVAMHNHNSSIADVASAEGLNATLLQQWVELVRLGSDARREIRGQFAEKLANAGGNDSIDGWGFDQTPNMLTNLSTEVALISTLTIPPRSVVVHPSPTQESMVAWRSPLDGYMTLAGLVADADGNCGNGVAWRIELLSKSGIHRLAEGSIDNGGQQSIQIEQAFPVRQDDVVSLLVNSRESNHACDTTHVALTLREVVNDEGKSDRSNLRQWDLAADIVDRIHDGNPLADSYGNIDVWHFGATDSGDAAQTAIPPNSSLAKWRTAVVAEQSFEEIAALASRVHDVLRGASAESYSSEDQTLRELLLDFHGPLRWITVANELSATLDVARGDGTSESDQHRDQDRSLELVERPLSTNGAEFVFGQHPDGSVAADPTSLWVRSPQEVVLRLPAALVSGGEFVVSAEFEASASRGAGAQVLLSGEPATAQPMELNLSTTLPILVSSDGDAKALVEAAMDEFRELFPAALCYSRIVPVDEVVTLTLFFRDDEHLQRLMLDGSQAAELDRLWDELFFVAQEPIALTVAFEQIYQFATQDRPDLVNAFEPMRQPINARGDRFRQRLKDTEPKHVQGVIEFADRAWRRPLQAAEVARLHDFYAHLRQTELSHDEAIQLMIARVLSSPSFIYRREQPASAEMPLPVTSSELASRLSYFLWSSMPDAELRLLADAGQLTNEREIIAQTRRMLAESKTRRLAVQFACQWLHLRGFDQNNDKNEQLFPEFASLRDDMYEETVLFFEDMFRRNGSMLDLIDADHTFLNESLAAHYGISGVVGPEWRRVEHIGAQGRGGVLGMASLLASQSGASRTSPILRGNWVYETLLGQRLPRPPAGVPLLPEELPVGLTARQLIEQHSSVPACARCHVKIDHFGFALEQYDAIGRKLTEDVDTRTQTAEGTKMEGLGGLQDYLLNERRSDVIRQFCRKLLGFSLGREVQLSDEPLLDTMAQRLKENDYRFQVAVETIVTSDQFRKIRGPSDNFIAR